MGDESVTISSGGKFMKNPVLASQSLWHRLERTASSSNTQLNREMQSRYENKGYVAGKSLILGRARVAPQSGSRTQSAAFSFFLAGTPALTCSRTSEDRNDMTA
jgi:hypothetical protein